MHCPENGPVCDLTAIHCNCRPTLDGRSKAHWIGWVAWIAVKDSKTRPTRSVARLRRAGLYVTFFSSISGKPQQFAGADQKEVIGQALKMVRGQFAMKSSPKVRPILSIDLDDNQPETRTDSFAVGGCKMMRIELMMLLALIAVCARPVSAQAKCPVAEVDQILTNPNQYNGTILALHGIAGTVALQSRTFTVLDAKSSTTGGASARFIRVTFPAKSQIVMPAPGQEVVVVGKIVNRLSTVRSVALQVLTKPSDIRHILAQDSKTRSSGRPSGDLPERNTNH